MSKQIVFLFFYLFIFYKQWSVCQKWPSCRPWTFLCHLTNRKKIKAKTAEFVNWLTQRATIAFFVTGVCLLLYVVLAPLVCVLRLHSCLYSSCTNLERQWEHRGIKASPEPWVDLHAKVSIIYVFRAFLLLTV